MLNPVKIIRHPQNKGLAAARNTALESAKGEFLATVDTDALPDPYWLERLMLAFTEDRIAGVGGRLIEKYTITAVDRWRQIFVWRHQALLGADLAGVWVHVRAVEHN